MKRVILLLFILCLLVGCSPSTICGDGRLDKGETAETCCIDAGCDEEGKVCERGECVDPTCGECQYLEDDVCYDYMCCSNEDCLDHEICVDNVCEFFSCDGDCEYKGVHGCFSYICCSDEDCNYGNTNTEDTCLNPQTEDAECSYIESEDTENTENTEDAEETTTETTTNDTTETTLEIINDLEVDVIKEYCTESAPTLLIDNNEDVGSDYFGFNHFNDDKIVFSAYDYYIADFPPTLFVYDIQSDQIDTIFTDQSGGFNSVNGLVSGDYVLFFDSYEDSLNKYDINTGTSNTLIDNNPDNPGSLDIDGNYLVWHADPEGGIAEEVFLLDIDSEEVIQLTSDTTKTCVGNGCVISNAKDDTEISGNYIIWERNSKELYLYDISAGITEYLPINSYYGISNPEIYGDYIIFKSFFDMYIYQISTGEIKKLSNHDEDRIEGIPRVYGDYAAWTNYEDRNFVYKFSTNTLQEMTVNGLVNFSISAIYDDKLLLSTNDDSNVMLYLLELSGCK
ncbi:hypothetical protein HOD38_02370 [archaeon]|jgi:hypothetical protein|nr:hypothetical protein [archaeon]MBT4397087.1 hypothetical protein [archaeon]MBT4441186.1 hypothetical protein [archaeon]